MSIIVLLFVESQRFIYGAPISYVANTQSVVLLNKKHIYFYLKCFIYDKLLKSRLSFLTTLYFPHKLHLSYLISFALKSYETFNAGLGVLYWPLILFTFLASVHCISWIHLKLLRFLNSFFLGTPGI